MDTFIAIYFIIGISYVIINGAIRKLENDDPLLTFCWLLFWPMFFILLGINKIRKL